VDHGTWAWSIYTVQLQLHLTIYIARDQSAPSNCIYHLHFTQSIHTIQLHLPFTFHAIDPHHPTASTSIYLSRDRSIHTIQLHLPFYISCDRSTPSNCIYHLHCTWSIHTVQTASTILHGTCWSIHTVQVYQLFWVAPGLINRHRPTAILLILHRASSKPWMELGFPAFAHFATQFRYPFLRAQDPTERNEQSNNPNCFSSTPPTKFNMIPSGAFFCFRQRKKQTKNPIMW